MDNIQKTIYENKDFDDYTIKIAKGADTRIELMRRYLAEAIKEKGTDLKVLDLGCADGEMFKDFAQKTQFYGVDISESFLKKAEKNGYKTCLMDVEKSALPFTDGFFDIVITGETIEHVVDTDWFMCELNRVLRKDGNMIISIPNINQWISVFMMLLADLPPRYSARFRAAHVRDFTFKTMKRCIKEFGFTIKKRQGTGIFLPFISRNIFAGLTKLVPRIATEVVFLCQKNSSILYDKKRIIEF